MKFSFVFEDETNVGVSSISWIVIRQIGNRLTSTLSKLRHLSFSAQFNCLIASGRRLYSTSLAMPLSVRVASSSTSLQSFKPFFRYDAGLHKSHVKLWRGACLFSRKRFGCRDPAVRCACFDLVYSIKTRIYLLWHVEKIDIDKVFDRFHRVDVRRPAHLPLSSLT